MDMLAPFLQGLFPHGPFMTAAVGAFTTSLFLGVALILFRPVIEHLIRDRDDHRAVQASHTGDPLRLGGVPVIIGILVGATLIRGQDSVIFMQLVLLSLTPVFGAGLIEDLGYRVSAKGRFAAAIVAAILSVFLLGHWVWRGDLLFLDLLLGWPPFAIAVTIVLAGVFCHSVNLIDGMNGLAASAVICAALGIGIVATHAGQEPVAGLSFLLAAGTLGFLCLNWPNARLFLGDAGAYGLGHILVWLGISLAALAPSVAVPAIVLILFHPFADTIHTVARRFLARKSLMEPDRMHLHQKFRRGIELIWIGRGRRRLSNPLATVFMLPVIAAPVISGVLVWDSPELAWILIVIFGAAFTAMHMGITAVAKRYRKVSTDGVFLGTFGLQYEDSISEVGGFSPYCGMFVQDGVAVNVIISRPGADALWHLKTETDGMQDRTWSAVFESDHAAWKYFCAQVDQFGMDAVLGRRKREAWGDRDLSRVFEPVF